MPGKEDIMNALKEAMKAKDALRLNAIRQIKNEILKIETSGGSAVADEAAITKAIQSLVKQHNDSIENYRKGNRDDLVASEEAEMGVLKEFLPEEISPEELRNLVQQVISEIGAASMKDMGRVMGMVRGKIGQMNKSVDGKLVADQVKDALS